MAMSVMEIHADSISDLLSAEPHRRLEVKKVPRFPAQPCSLTHLRYFNVIPVAQQRPSAHSALCEKFVTGDVHLMGVLSQCFHPRVVPRSMSAHPPHNKRHKETGTLHSCGLWRAV